METGTRISQDDNNHPDHIGGLLQFDYPDIPVDTDFETFRKKDPSWIKLIDWYNEPLPHSREIENKDETDGKSSKKNKKERFVALQWPRDHAGGPISLLPPGKTTNNGLHLWGATLYDFYRFYRVPGNMHLSTISSGSRLAAWMKQAGEVHVATQQLRQAELEQVPRKQRTYAIANFFSLLEREVHFHSVGKSMKGVQYNVKQDNSCLFDLDKYAGRWPLVPFSAPTYRLQERWPLAMLPRKLIVHDPWRVLETSIDDIDDNESESDQSRSTPIDGADGEGQLPRQKHHGWGTRPDVVHTYNLKLENEPPQPRATSSTGVVHDYVITPEAHLYISPSRRMGKGHHSFVYQVELELPRDLLVPYFVCTECSISSALKDSKDGGLRMTDEEADDKILQAEFSIVYNHGLEFLEHHKNDMRFKYLKYVRRQHGSNYCEHKNPEKIPIPPSHKVSVLAKLSLPVGSEDHPEHLWREAKNYAEFPGHFFEHWNGYNVIWPIQDPVPVGPVVPQFYGYYVPDKSCEPSLKGKFLSPILLLEHCGVPVNPLELTHDEKMECFSLLRRLNIAGYAHNSVYGRNFVMQHGPLQVSPFERSAENNRFRLIDFGRTEVSTNSLNGTMEYMDAEKELKLGMVPGFE